jgi:uncharacterized protein (DUF302 family)
MTNAIMSYQFRMYVDVPYENAIEQVTDALKTEGFGVLTEIDVKATLKKKLDVDFRKYVILGACNPALAHQALEEELDIGLLLPCNVIIFEGERGDSIISIIDPFAMFGLVENPNLENIANEARIRLQRVAATIESIQS